MGVSGVSLWYGIIVLIGCWENIMGYTTNSANMMWVYLKIREPPNCGYFKGMLTIDRQIGGHPLEWRELVSCEYFAWNQSIQWRNWMWNWDWTPGGEWHRLTFTVHMLTLFKVADAWPGARQFPYARGLVFCMLKAIFCEIGWYPPVSCPITMENHHFFMGNSTINDHFQ
jgi:hypothetical protein